MWGFDGPAGYTTIDGSSAAACASLYHRHGREFIAGLNGNFVGLLYDRHNNKVLLFTDRLGTRPLYYAETSDGMVFSTNIQSLPLHPAVETGFDVEYLAEYFTLQRSLGLTTPLENVELLHPGSVTTVSLDNMASETERYWEPIYNPVDKSRSHFTSRIAEILQQAVSERTAPDTEYGLLLSGGSDSRLVLAALMAADVPVQTYHIGDWMNSEARSAEQVAMTADIPFTWLRRDRDYQARALASMPEIANFISYFNQPHANGFADTLTDEVDVLFTGHYGDMLLKGNSLPTRNVDLGRIGSFSLPIEKPIDTLEEFISSQIGSAEAPRYIQEALSRSITDIYAANISDRSGRITDHGVSYNSLRSAVVSSGYPLTNTASQFFYYGTLQMMPSATPFLDNRLIDLFLSIPRKHLLRGNLIGGAIEHLAPSLAKLPHGATNVPLTSSSLSQWLGSLVTGFKHRHLSRSLAAPYWTQGPWPNHNELIRSHEFIRETLTAHEELIRALPFLTWSGINECYQAHLNGENNLAALYTLATFLQMPVVQRIVDTDS